MHKPADMNQHTLDINYEPMDMNQIATKKKTEDDKHFTCANLSFELMSTFIFC